jgi:hypothetical protein
MINIHNTVNNATGYVVYTKRGKYSDKEWNKRHYFISRIKEFLMLILFLTACLIRAWVFLFYKV